MREIRNIVFLLIYLFASSAFAQKISKEDFENIYQDTVALEEKLEEIEGRYGMTDSFYTYKEAFVVYLETLKTPQPSSEQDLLKQAKEASVILYGDDHSSSISQNNFIRLIEAAAEDKERPMTVVIEWVDKKHQTSIDQYLNGEIDSEQLKEQVEYDRTWGFPWGPHLRILDVAKQLGVPVMAVENKMNKNGQSIYLRTRDNNVVRTIENDKRKNKDMRYVISYGTFHLSGGEDPHLKEKLTAIGLEPELVIYPYSNGAYWDVLEDTLDMDAAKVLKYSNTEYFYYQGTVDRILDNLRHYLKLSETNIAYLALLSALRTKGVMPQKSCESLLAS